MNTKMEMRKQALTRSAVAKWDYKGPVQTKQIRKLIGISFLKDFRPGITKRPEGWSFLRNGNKLFCLQTKNIALALFHSHGKWHFRKSKNIERIFMNWAFRDSPSVINIPSDIWNDSMKSESFNIMTKEEYNRFFGANNAFDITKDVEFNRMPYKVTVTKDSKKYNYMEDPFYTDPSTL